MIIKNINESSQFVSYERNPVLTEKFIKDNYPLYVHNAGRITVLFIHGIDGCICVALES